MTLPLNQVKANLQKKAAPEAIRSSLMILNVVQASAS